jgi:hypothetical protein
MLRLLSAMLALALVSQNAWAIGCAVGEPTPIDCRRYVPQSSPYTAPNPAPYPLIMPNGGTATIYPNYSVGGPSSRCVMQPNGSGGYILRC